MNATSAIAMPERSDGEFITGYTQMSGIPLQPRGGIRDWRSGAGSVTLPRMSEAYA
jgi:hypothetical protein